MAQQQRSGRSMDVRTGIGFRTSIHVRDHHFVADEPIDKGGTNDGPTPTEMMTAALASCTSITMRMYADRKGWPVRAIDIHVEHRRVDEIDDTDPQPRPRRVDVFDLAITIDGDLTVEQRDRLLYIAGRCPVKRALEGSSRITTSLED